MLKHLYIKHFFKFLAIWLASLLVLFLVSGCDVSKKAIKTKTDKNTQNDVTTTGTIETENKTKTITETSGFDFGTVDMTKFRIHFEPINASEQMQIVNQLGDTLRSTNAKVAYETKKVKTNNNKTQTTTNTVEYYRFERQQQVIEDLTKTVEQLKAKASEKTEKINTTAILYFVIGFVVIVAIGLLLIYRSIHKYIKTTETMISLLTPAEPILKKV